MGGNVIYMLCCLALFGGQLWYGVRNKTWSFTGTVCADVLGEAVGYISRIMLDLDPFSINFFFVNCIAPTMSLALLTAGIYLSFGRIIVVIRADYPKFKRKAYTYVFIGCDLLALVPQAIGGGMAATAGDKDSSRTGVNIMIAGLMSQIIIMTLFLALWGEFPLRVRHAKISSSLSCTQPPLYDYLSSTKNFSCFQWSLLIATLLIYVRCIYCVAELWTAFGRDLADHEATFMVFEGPMIVLTVAALTVFHRG